MQRVVLDPSVLVSAVLSSSGAPAEVLDRWRDGEFDVIVSPQLLRELEDVLLRPKFATFVDEQDARAYVDALAGEGIVVADPEDPEPLTRDPGDDYLVALAIAAAAEAIVSVDADLLELEHPPLPMLSPRQLVDLLGAAA